MTCGSMAEEERINRSGRRAMISSLALPGSTAWWIVGAAVYQVGRSVSSHP